MFFLSTFLGMFYVSLCSQIIPNSTINSQPSLNGIAAESKASPEKQNSAVRWIAIFSYFPKKIGEEPPVVVL